MNSAFRTSLLFPVLACTLWGQAAPIQTPIPGTGPGVFRQRLVDLTSNLRVLNIALQPGFEDLAVLASLRLGRGAKIMSLYATNGEAGESDAALLYPPQLAAARREEAVRAIRTMSGECYFLNLPDPAAVADTTELRTFWLRDTVQTRLMRVISNFRPDLIIVSRDPESSGPSLRWRELVADILQSVERIALVPKGKMPKESFPFSRWSVNRVLAEDGSGNGLVFRTGDVNRIWKKSYDSIGEEAGREYRSAYVQRAHWRSGRRVAFQVVFPRGGEKLQRPDQGLPVDVSNTLRSIGKRVDQLAQRAGQLRDDQLPARTSPVLTMLLNVLDSVDIRLVRSFELQTRERATLLQWKEGLENLRQSLLGVSVSLSVSESVLTDNQLMYVTIDTVNGLSPQGKTELYVPSLGKEWVLNESLDNHLPLKLHEPFRLLIQNAKPYTVPHWEYGLENNTLGRPLYLFLVHQAPRRAESFIYRSIIPMNFAPKFTAEILTPLVRAVPGERLVVRLTNNSRDGVKDELFVSDSLVTSTRSPFRLSQKGETHLDTLLLTWNERLGEGSHLLPVSIDGEIVGRFVARKFSVRVDSSKRVGILLGVENSPTLDALRRLGIGVTIIQAGERLGDQLSLMDVLIVDRRALTFQKEAAGLVVPLEQFVQRGGHLIVLAQDADVWNRSGFLPSVTLRRSLALSPTRSIRLDTLLTQATHPNDLRNEEWSEWLYRRAYNEVQVASGEPVDVLLRDAASGMPFAMTQKRGKGFATYLDLDLQHQWMNIHAVAFRLFANVLAH